MIWIEVKASVNAQAVEAVTEVYYEFGANGVSIEEPIQAIGKDKNLYWDYIDENNIDRTTESKVIAYYPSVEKNLDQKIEQIKKRIAELRDFGIDTGSAKIEISSIDQEDWENSWKQYFKPIHVTDKIVIKPQWEEYDVQANELIIQIDPGMAFGTGSHETTSMCICGLEKHIKQDQTVLDIGTGSGILAIASALLGAKHIVGVDLDPVAVEVAKENIRLNKVESKVDIRHGDLVSSVEGKYDIVVANIIAEAIVILLDIDVRSFVKEDGLLICSGIILEKEKLILDKLSEKGFEVQSIDRQGEWVCIISTVNNG
ncbi:MAG: 50S ribosomal protein L11 methyltransferase [Peptostreptococcaceae bacterium]|nr:50S ribosomal protein L11 methyltransferase [Peptostreptococcaceae bacterium]